VEEGGGSDEHSDEADIRKKRYKVFLDRGEKLIRNLIHYLKVQNKAFPQENILPEKMDRGFLISRLKLNSCYFILNYIKTHFKKEKTEN
jgi:hypothetical protein